MVATQRTRADARYEADDLPAPATADYAVTLAALGELAMSRADADPDRALGRACALVRAVLDAEDAYVIRAGDPHFIRVGCEQDPTAYELHQKGYFIVWRELAADPALTGGTFRAEDR